jgi:CBS domain-containing membrane protein
VSASARLGGICCQGLKRGVSRATARDLQHARASGWASHELAVAHEEGMRVQNKDATVGELMTHAVLTVEQNQKLTTADDVMRLGHVRHVLVVDEEGALQGVVSQRDLFLGGLLRALGYGSRSKEQALESLRVKDAMRTVLVTTAPNTTLESAARLMAENKIGCLPVLDEGRLVGILTEGDFVLWVAGEKVLERAPPG